MKFTEIMAELWNVDASNVVLTADELRLYYNSYYKQEALARELIAMGLIIDPNKDCAFMRAWGKAAQTEYENRTRSKKR